MNNAQYNMNLLTKNKSKISCVSDKSLVVNKNEFDVNQFVKTKVLVPYWWLNGVVFSLLKDTKIKEDNSFLFNNEKEFWVNDCFNYKFLALISNIWSYIILKISENKKNHNITEIDIPLYKYISGTVTEITEQLNFLNSYWISPYKSCNNNYNNIKKTKKSENNNFSLHHLIKKSYVIHNTNPTLHIEFNTDLYDCCLGKSFFNFKYQNNFPFIVLNPNVLKAFSFSRSIKSLLYYLLIELAKNRKDLRISDTLWYASVFNYANIVEFHKELLKRSRDFYDFGILGWDNSLSISDLRIADIRQKKHDKYKSIIHCWRMSDNTENILDIEKAYCLINTDDFIHNKENIIDNTETITSIAQAPKQKNISLVSNDNINVNVKFIREKTMKTRNVKEDDFILKLTEYYSNLTDEEQEQLNIDKQKMSEEQFVRYMSRILGIKYTPQRVKND